MRFFRRVFKIALAQALYRSGYAVRYWRSKQKPLLLAYHRIVEENDCSTSVSYKSLHITPGLFDQQVQFLKKHFKLNGYNQDPNSFSSKVCIITFDDGWIDNFSNALPILKNHDASAIFFLATEFLGSNDLYWTHKLIYLLTYERRKTLAFLSNYEIKISDQLKNFQIGKIVFEYACKVSAYNRNRFIGILISKYNDLRNTRNEFNRYFMNAEEIGTLSDSGMIIGSHTVSHHPLTIQNESRIVNELNISKKKLESIINQEVTTISFPHSLYNKNVLASCENSGYGVAFTGEKKLIDTSHFKKIKLFRRVSVYENNSVYPNGSFSPALFFCSCTGLMKDLGFK